MKSGLYVIFDKDAQQAGPVFNAINDRIAWRNFMNMIEREQGNVAFYELYKVGVYDPSTMKIVPEEMPIIIVYEGTT